MKASLLDRGGTSDRRFPAAWLALALTLLMPLQVRTEESLRGTPAASVFELARPRHVLTADQRKQMLASRGRMLQMIALLTDRENPLELEAEALGTARVHVAGLSQRVDRLLWVHTQATRETTSRDAELHVAFMRDPAAHRLLSEPWRELDRELRRLYPGGGPEGELEIPEPLPPDPVLDEWKHSVGDHRVNAGGDPFLQKRLLHLATIRLSRHRGPADASTDRLVRAVRAAEDLWHDCSRDWALLFRLVVAANPEIVEQAEGIPEPAFEDFAAELRRTASSFR